MGEVIHFIELTSVGGRNKLLSYTELFRAGEERRASKLNARWHRLKQKG